MVEPFHIPVMISEVLSFLKVKESGIYIDCTLGGGGHTRAILEKDGRVIGIDRDAGAVEYTEDKLVAYNDRFEAHVTTFSNIIEVSGIYKGEIDGVVMDLGVSSRMIDDPSRGFSYKKDGPLLMNMGCSDVNAFEIVNTKSKKELSLIFKEYGEERHARRIAGSIINFRSSHSIKTTSI
nr:16S rRNA (cytosine(1402)-N(4))-methyltransferase RsmH [Bacteroidota bacterium]